MEPVYATFRAPDDGFLLGVTLFENYYEDDVSFR
jgi:hypothetical protein